MFVAGKGVGAFDSWSEIERFLTIEAVTTPNPGNHVYYQRQFEIYRELYKANPPLFSRIVQGVE